MHLHDQWISPPDQHNEEEDIHEAYNDISGKIMRRISAGAVTGCVDSRAEQWAAPESRLAETTLPEKTMYVQREVHQHRSKMTARAQPLHNTGPRTMSMTSFTRS